MVAGNGESGNEEIRISSFHPSARLPPQKPPLREIILWDRRAPANMTLRMQQTPVEWELLRDYVERGSEPSFARLVAAHVDMVFSAALRQCGDRAMAEDVTQAVFIILARKAPKLKPGAVLGAWLHQTACYTAMNAIKAKARRRRHEQRAAEMNAELRRVDSSWHQLA